jgi:hypothetical protein
VRKTRTLEAALPWLYLKGISSGEMGAALEVLVGPDAKGLPAQIDAGQSQASAARDLAGCDEGRRRESI